MVENERHGFWLTIILNTNKRYGGFWWTFKSLNRFELIWWKERNLSPLILITKSQMKKNKKLARSVGQSYDTRSKDVTPHMFL
jgi:hypothetical protein